MCATTNLYREAADFLALWQECPRLRSAIRFGNESCDNSYTIIEANVTITRVNFLIVKLLVRNCASHVNNSLKTLNKIMNTKPFDRSVGTVIKILNEPIVIKNNKLLMSCIVNDCLIDRIPLRYFRRLSNYRELSDFNSFTKRVYRTQNFIELHQLLQGKTVKVVAKTILSNGATAPIFELIKG